MKKIWTEPELNAQIERVGEHLNISVSQTQLLLAQERFMARLALLKEGKNFILKGGSLILRCYQNMKFPRYTIDIDLMVNKIPFEKSEEIIQKAAIVKIEDGFKFFDLKKEFFRRETPYGGERYTLNWSWFGRGQSNLLRIDVCMGDDVDAKEIPNNELFLIPDNINVSMMIYPPEFIFAEKLETAIRFYTGNTRAKDFIDMWALLQKGLNPQKAHAAIIRCFERRNVTFNPDRLNLFKNEAFIAVIQGYLNKRFKDLELPSANIIFSNIYEFLKKITLT